MLMTNNAYVSFGTCENTATKCARCKGYTPKLLPRMRHTTRYCYYEITYLLQKNSLV